MPKKQCKNSMDDLPHQFSTLECGLNKSTIFDQKSFQCRNTSCSTSRKAKILFNKREKTDTG